VNLEEVLAHLEQRFAELTEREEKGEDVAAEKAAIEAQKNELQARQEPEDELTRLRKQVAESSRRDIARNLAEQIVSGVVMEQRKEEEELAKMVQTEVASLLGGGDLQTAVKSVLASTRTPSRFVGEAASPSVVEHVAAGNGVATVGNGAIRVDHAGAKAEAKEIRESKNMGKFCAVVAKAHRGEMWLTDGEKEFLRGITQKALAEGTDSAGGYLVPQEWMPDILGLLRANAIVRGANPRFVPFNKQMNQTSISSGASASYTAENSRITPSEQVFAEAVLMTPKNLTAMVPVSNYLLADAANADSLIRDDMVEVIALREDLAFLRGTGGSGEPLGLRNKVGTTLDPITPPTNGFQPSMADLRIIRAYYLNNNAGAVELAWFFHPAFFAYLSTQTDADGHFLLDANLLSLDADGRGGVLDGTRFYLSTQIPINLTQGASSNATDIMLVNMRECIVGINQELELAVSTEAAWSADGTNWNSAFQQNQTLFRAVVRHDIAHRRPSQILVQRGVLV
jgi:HK97 family phage major capsid protein